MIILGAGMAGCLAGFVFSEATIIEAKDNTANNHQALLRFRSDKISELTGIPFEKVTIHKAVWSEGKFAAPSPRISNLYSRKVAGNISERSIHNLASDTRWIAPENFHQQMINKLKDRISFSTPVEKLPIPRPIISTLPIFTLSELLGESLGKQEVQSSSIWIQKYKVPDAQIYQTVYFPDHNTPIYRASLTKDLLTIESMEKPSTPQCKEVEYSLGIEGIDSIETFSGEQKLGKIVPLPDPQRKELLFRFTHKHNIFSLGRFACWRNILMDDVYKDILQIRKMLSQNIYDIRKEM